MSNDLSSFTRLEQSAIHEMANIGLGHAITSLSNLTGHSFNMSVPKVEAVALEHVPDMIGGSEEAVVAIYMEIDGDVSGHMAFLFPWKSAQNIWSMLLGSCPEEMCDIDDLRASAMLETGNIINSSFMDALSEMTGLKIHATPPLVSVDICYSIVSSIVAEAELGNAVALAIETKIFETGSHETEGYFLCIPDKESLDLFFKQLNIKECA